MAFIGALLKDTIKMGGSLVKERHQKAPKLQYKVLKKLIETAQFTEFGKHYEFSKLLEYKENDLVQAFEENVPIFDYNKIHKDWWNRSEKGESNICWPGKIKFFALTSGTSESASKRVPITSNMLRSFRKTSIRQVYSLSKLDLPRSFYEKGMLILGGSTSLINKETFKEGDLSGILATKLPVWVYKHYRPRKDLARIQDWDLKLNKIVEQAKDWDIGIITGVPTWYQLLFEKIIDYYKVDNIHDIWPNLKFFVHGGVAFDSYKDSFPQFLGKEITYLETYLASEGFIAYQAISKDNMQLVFDSGIFLEFIPFNGNNFHPDGSLKDKPEVFGIDETKENEEYALLITTCAGAWRYLIGDVIKIINKATYEIIITGRTKMFLSLCGEHLSIDNMNKGIAACAEELNIDINEFTVAGTQNQHNFGHHWYLGIDNPNLDQEVIRESLDNHLKRLNDDYATERDHALKEMQVEILPTKIFYQWMQHIGKFGSQHKFPRVLKNDRLNNWKLFISKDLDQK